MVGESFERRWGSNGLVLLGILAGHSVYLVVSTTIPRQIYDSCPMGDIGQVP